MKILLVNKFLYPRGGSESYMLSLGKYYEEHGHEVEYFGMYDEKNTVGNSAEEYTSNMDFHSTGLSRFLYPFKIVYSFEAKKKIGKVLDSFKPDVVHMNNINFQLTPAIIYAVKKRNIPLVQTVHDYQMICPNHLLYNFQKNEPCEKCLSSSKLHCIKNKCIHGSLIKSIIGYAEAKFYSLLKTYKKVDLYVCPSTFLENKLLSAKSYYKGKTLTLHNFINEINYTPKDTQNNSYIVYVGRLSKEKGVELLAETAKLLPDYTFKVAGNGPDDEVLKNIDNITLLGFVGGENLWELISNAKALILPSVCYENCPISILEAHSLGVPVITMNYGGMAELVKDGFNGSLVKAPTPEDIAHTVKFTLEDSHYYTTIKENAKKEKDNIQTVDDYCNILLENYNRLINAR